MITGIICEYNPLHLGHEKQIRLLKAQDPEGAVVCLMSGNYVQRGAPSVFHKSIRAEAALLSGADLVLELPITASLSSAEGFAAAGVRILGSFCDRLCFGAESSHADALTGTARALLQPEFSPALKEQLDKGLSFPAARQQALARLGMDGTILETPNNILAVEYCKAIISQNSEMKPMPIFRPGSYHDTVPSPTDPSATAVRQLIGTDDRWLSYVPAEARELLANATVHTLDHAENAILYRLRTMTDADYEALPYGSEGLWRKLMHAAHKESRLETVLTAVKSKRYTRTRLDRMIMCAFLGITAQDIAAPVPYTRILGFNDRGRQVLKRARESGEFINIGEKTNHPYEVLEHRSGSLYGLFAYTPEPPDKESGSRVIYR